MLRQRAGFGTTIGIVLVIVGIALIAILGSDQLSRGSRVTFQRAMYAARATQIAEEAVTEVCLSPANKQQFLDMLIESGAQALGQPRSPAIIASFLQFINPDNVASPVRGVRDDARPAPLGVSGMQVVEGCSGMNVAFGKGFREIEARAVAAAHAQEGILKIGKVKIRAVTYCHDGTPGGGPEKHHGIARATVSVSYRPGRGTITRKVTVDHVFNLVDLSVPGTPLWDIVIEPKPRQREVSDDDAVI